MVLTSQVKREGFPLSLNTKNRLATLYIGPSTEWSYAMTQSTIISNLLVFPNQHADNETKLQPTQQKYEGIIKSSKENRFNEFTADLMELSGIASAIDFAIILSTPSLIGRIPRHLHVALKRAVSNAFDSAYHEAFEVISRHISWHQQDPSVKETLRNFLRTPDGAPPEIDICLYHNAIGMMRGNCETELRSLKNSSVRDKFIREACESALLLSDESILTILSPTECQALNNCLDAYVRPYLSALNQLPH
jgi:hypothetical protein